MGELAGGGPSAGGVRSVVRLCISRLARWVGSTARPLRAYSAAASSSPWIQAIWARRAKAVGARLGDAVASSSLARASS